MEIKDLKVNEELSKNYGINLEELVEASDENLDVKKELFSKVITVWKEEDLHQLTGLPEDLNLDSFVDSIYTTDDFDKIDEVVSSKNLQEIDEKLSDFFDKKENIANELEELDVDFDTIESRVVGAIESSSKEFDSRKNPLFLGFLSILVAAVGLVAQIARILIKKYTK